MFFLLLVFFVVLNFIGYSKVHACGGFFCNNQAPTVQQGEKILFSQRQQGGKKLITALIQISYTGDADDFSWVLPLPSTPDFGVGSDAVFNALMRSTMPQFEIKWANDDNCGLNCYIPGIFARAGTADEDGGVGEAPKVQVLAEGQVGSFNYQVLFDTTMEGQAMFDWLVANDYQQPPAAADIIKSYARKGNVFVGLKLQKDKEAGDIQPVELTYESPGAMSCVPVVLTKIATAQDLPIFIWMLGEHRAMPINYFDVQPDFSSFDWIGCQGDSLSFTGFGFRLAADDSASCMSKYTQVVKKTLEPLKGKGFVTEYSGSTDIMKDQLWSDSQETLLDLDKLKTFGQPGEFLQQALMMGIPRDATTQNIIRKWIPKPPESELTENCKTDQQFYSWNTDECVKQIANWHFDPSSMADALDKHVIQPLRDAQTHILSFTTMTRLFSTMTADQMTADPFFDFNADLPAVSRVHQADGTCVKVADTNKVDVTLTFANGRTKQLQAQSTCGWQPPWLPPVIGSPVISVIPTGSGAARPIALANVDAELATLLSVNCTGSITCSLNGADFSVPKSGPTCEAVCPGDPSNSACVNCDLDDVNAAVCWKSSFLFVLSVALAALTM